MNKLPSIDRLNGSTRQRTDTIITAPRAHGVRAVVLAQTQQGSTLIISLLMLVLLMLLGVAGMNASQMQYQLAGNLQFEKSALDKAETAVSAGEQWLEANAASTPSASAAALISPLTMTWTDADPVHSVALTINGTADDTQRYVIGFVSTNASPLAGVGLNCLDPSNERNFDCVNTYQVTARGQSGRGANKFVQTYYAVPRK